MFNIQLSESFLTHNSKGFHRKVQVSLIMNLKDSTLRLQRRSLIKDLKVPQPRLKKGFSFLVQKVSTLKVPKGSTHKVQISFKKVPQSSLKKFPD